MTRADALLGKFHTTSRYLFLRTVTVWVCQLTRRYGDDPDAHGCQISCDWERHSNNAAFRCWICCLSDLRPTKQTKQQVDKAAVVVCLCVLGVTCPSKAATLAVLMMHPLCPSASGSFFPIILTARRITLNVPAMFTCQTSVDCQQTNGVHLSSSGLSVCLCRTLITRWKSSRLWGTSLLKLYVFTATAMPAQFTARSNFPNFSRARDTADWTSASDVTCNTASR